MRHVMAAIAAAGLLAACGGGGGGGNSNPTTTTVSCLFTNSVCFEITAVMTTTDQTNIQTSCTTGSGIYAATTCTTTGAVAGHCHYTGAAVVTITGVTIAGATMNEYYYTASWTPGDAQTDCGLDPAGTWTP